MTLQERLIISAYTGTLMCDVDKLHEYIEEVLGHPVFTHELADSSVLEEVKKRVKPDFMALCGND